MDNLVHIGNADISIKEYKGKRVVTFKDIDMAHERPDGTARKRFSDNRKHFVEGEDYFVLKPSDLENSGMSEFRTSGITEVNPRGTAFITEQGYLMLVKSFTDDLAWEVQRKLVSSYFNVHQSVNDQLSPELQALQGLLNQMVQKELADKERDRQIAKAQDTAQKAIETTEHIKEAVKPVFDNWRNEINAKFNRIQRNADCQFNVLRTEMYSELEHRAGCDLSRRIRNRRERMAESGCTKTEISALNKMDIIEDDKKLREIFSKIVAEYEIRYCA
jgi:hypothetical protein